MQALRAALMHVTENVVRLMANERTFQLPSGFREHLRKHLDTMRGKE